MSRPSYRDVHLAEARREARRALAPHELVSLVPGAGAASFASPTHDDNAFDVVALGWRSVVVHGDFEAVVFQGGDGGDVFERVDWLASMGAHDAAVRARWASGKSYDEFHPKAFAQCIFDAAEGETGERRRDLKALAVEAVREGMAEHEAVTRALDLGVEFGEADVSVYDRSLVLAHEAARAASRLLRPDALFDRLCLRPSEESLAWYNLAVRGSKNRFHARVAEQIRFEASCEPAPGGCRRA